MPVHTHLGAFSQQPKFDNFSLGHKLRQRFQYLTSMQYLSD